MDYMKIKVLIVTLVALLLTLTGIVYDSTNGALTRLGIQRITLSSPKIPSDFNELTLVYFTDLHAHTLSDAYYKKVIDSINAMNPDFVVFGGDLIDEGSYATYSETQRKALITLMSSIKAPYGKYAVLSDLDLIHQTELETLYLEAGFEILNQKLIPIHALGSNSINFLGWDSTSTSASLASLTQGEYTLAFGHDPQGAKALNASLVDVMFAGKTHGGQITLPLFGSLVSSDEDYLRGHYQLSPLDLYVSSGIGVSKLKARWLTDPSYTLITFKSK